MDESRDETRREFLRGVKRWSGAVAALAVTGGFLADGAPAAAWVNGTWANRSGGWINHYGGGGGAWINGGGGGWVNRGGGSTGWVNCGGGGAGWVNRYGGGGGAWVNRH
jgi:hypothetical protein